MFLSQFFRDGMGVWVPLTGQKHLENKWQPCKRQFYRQKNLIPVKKRHETIISVISRWNRFNYCISNKLKYK